MISFTQSGDWFLGGASISSTEGTQPDIMAIKESRGTTDCLSTSTA